MPLDGRVVAVTADRRWQEQADLFRKRGAEVLHAPTMRTIDLTADEGLRVATEAIIASPPAWLVVTTGAGFRLWFDALGDLAAPLKDALVAGPTRVIARGAKGASAVRGAGLDVHWRAEHESMEEVVEYATSAVAAGDSVALQLFDPDEHWSTKTLRNLVTERGGAAFVEVPVYRWRLPDDIGPARAVVGRLCGGEPGIDAVTFTSQPAVRFLFSIARAEGGDAAAGAVRDAFASEVLAVCVGPVCAEALREEGVERMVFPDPPRLVPMVKLAEAELGPR